MKYVTYHIKNKKYTTLTLNHKYVVLEEDDRNIAILNDKNRKCKYTKGFFRETIPLVDFMEDLNAFEQFAFNGKIYLMEPFIPYICNTNRITQIFNIDQTIFELQETFKENYREVFHTLWNKFIENYFVGDTLIFQFENTEVLEFLKTHYIINEIKKNIWIVEKKLT